MLTEKRDFISDLDSLPVPAWDLVDARLYGRQASWTGILREDYYALISSSRGCPYGCFFCHNIFGKKARLRSPENVYSEMRALHEAHGFREFHFVDDVFNIDERRAAELCRLIITGGLRFSLAFPNGLRPDIMTPELIALLRKAGAYKINYGFETSSPRLQKLIGKNLDIKRASDAFRETSRNGIVTGAYFILGFPGQTRGEIMDTINFAAASPLDAAYFFKATPYPGSGFHDSVTSGNGGAGDFEDYHFYSSKRSYGDIKQRELNSLILLAQRKFFLRPGRILRGFAKTPRKREYLKNTVTMLALLLQAFLFSALAGPARRGDV